MLGTGWGYPCAVDVVRRPNSVWPIENFLRNFLTAGNHLEIPQVEPLAEECDLRLPEQRTVQSRKQACTACRGIPRILSAREDRTGL